jgi:TldD protein
MRNELAGILKGHNADYIEIRLEEGQSTRIVYRGPRLEEIGRNSGIGGNVRALVKGGWGFVSFNNLDNLRDKVELAVAQARLVGRGESKLSTVAPAVDAVAAITKKDPLAVPLESKKQLLDEYNDLILSTPKIQTSNISYVDGRKKTTFASSEGAYIEQNKVDISLRFTAIAAQDGSVRQIGLSLGSNGDFAIVEGLQGQVKEVAQRAARLLSAPQAVGVNIPLFWTRYWQGFLSMKLLGIYPSLTTYMKIRS